MPTAANAGGGHDDPAVMSANDRAGIRPPWMLVEIRREVQANIRLWRTSTRDGVQPGPVVPEDLPRGGVRERQLENALHRARYFESAWG
jgi:hypothetical protein